MAHGDSNSSTDYLYRGPDKSTGTVPGTRYLAPVPGTGTRSMVHGKCCGCVGHMYICTRIIGTCIVKDSGYRYRVWIMDTRDTYELYGYI